MNNSNNIQGATPWMTNERFTLDFMEKITSRYKVLSKEVEDEYWRQGDYEKLILHNMRWIIFQCSRYPHKKGEFPDLLQHGMMGVLRACKKYDPDKGFKFFTYAKAWIYAELGEFVYRRNHITVPSNQLWLAMKRAGDGTDATEISNERERMALSALNYTAPITWEEDDDAKDGERQDSKQLAYADEMYARSDFDCIDSTIDIEHYLECLDERSKFVIIHHYGLHDETSKTFAEVSRFLDLTPQRTQQIHADALKAIRVFAARELIAA
jgi:RNA polymerase primary sigma factor